MTVKEKRTGEELASVDRELIIHPQLDPSVTERVIMSSGDGCRLRDVNGREYLDATGGLWLAQIGHGRPEIAEAAAAQMEQLEFFMSFWEFSNERAIELAERLVEIAPPRQKHVYFTNGGSESNEAAIKMARFCHAQNGEPDRTWVLARHQAYHGVGYGSGAATGIPAFRENFGPLAPHFRHLTPPRPYHSELYGGADPTDFCIDELEQAIVELGPDKIAAFIGEPVMGVAGMIIPPDDYWPRVRELLTKHGITLIMDEVVTAYGRTGEWFASPRFGADPDIIVTAKGITSGYLPLGAVLVSDEIFDAATAGGFPMGFTYNGHPTTCAVALANLDVIESENLLERARDTGAYLLEKLTELKDLPVVGEVRGLGMMLAVELVKDKETREPLSKKVIPEDLIRRESGVIVRDCLNSIVISPPLIMTREEADEVVQAIRSLVERLDCDGNLTPLA